MSNSADDSVLSEQETREFRAVFADEFDQDLDPLVEYDQKFRQIEERSGAIGPRELFEERFLHQRNPADRTLENYETALKHWCNFMITTGRHYACPNRNHVVDFVEYLKTNHDNSEETIENKLILLNSVFKDWQSEQSLPQCEGFNPFSDVLSKKEFENPEKDPYHPISLEELREIVQSIKHWRDLPIILLQLKYGMRATAVTNVEIGDISLTNEEVASHYQNLGENPLLEECDDAIIIPASHEGNKSARTRVMPLDDEMRYVLGQYLTVRPSVDESKLFLTETSHTDGDREMVNNIWKKHIPERYLEDTEKYRGIRSHFGRHWFTTYWSLDDERYSRELIRYIRGDSKKNESMDEYIHVELDDVREPFLENVRKYLI